jgi:hypothetical protein
MKMKFNTTKFPTHFKFTGYVFEGEEFLINAVVLENYEQVIKKMQNKLLKSIDTSKINSGEKDKNKITNQIMENLDVSKIEFDYEEFAFSFLELKENKEEILGAFEEKYSENKEYFIDKFYKDFYEGFNQLIQNNTPS